MFEIVIYTFAFIGFLTVVLAAIGRKGVVNAWRQAMIVYKINKWGKSDGS